MTVVDLSLEQFLVRNNLTNEEFADAKISYDDLKEIAIDHIERIEQRKDAAELVARIIQRCKKVHSVRWRVKDPEHLMEKIVRKRIPQSKSYNEKYLNITRDNYHEIITDLVGVRALHLFKEDCFIIDTYLEDNFKSKEDKIAYIRNGDESETLKEHFKVKVHPAGYRSIHYVFETQPLKQIIYTEVQVRTIFEEGWSEIDHKIRYPNFSDNENVATFLQIFNRLAGSADEMGTFIKNLVTELSRVEQQRNDNEAEIDRLFNELQSHDIEQTRYEQMISKLKEQVDVLKQKIVSDDQLSQIRMTARGPYRISRTVRGTGKKAEN